MKKNITILSLCALLCGASVFAQESTRYPILAHMVHHNPGEVKFETRYVDADYIADLGYNMQIPKMEPQCGLTYDHWEDNIVPLNTEERMWIDRHAMSVRIQIDKAKAAGLEICPFTDIMVIPKSIMTKYGDEMKNEKGQLTISKARTQELIKAQIDELFERYPKLDGLTIRFGETYLHDTPHHVGSTPVRNVEEHIKLVELLREEVCVKRNKKVIYRTWDFLGLHTKPDLYLGVTEKVEPHKNLYFSIKHTNYDFLRDYPFNKTIGLGKHQQIVEVSINQAGIYGRNSHPYYIGKGIIDGWNDMPENERRGLRSLYNDKKIQGIWVWTWGDGWFGPYFDNEFWTELNEYIVRKFVENPERTEESIFYQYAMEVLKLDEANANKLRKLSLISEDAVYLGQSSAHCSYNKWAIRDHFFGCVDVKDAVKKGVQKEVRAEKGKAVELWYQIEELAKEITVPKKEDDEFLYVSSVYGRIKYELIEQIWNIQIMLSELELNNTPIDKEAAAKAIEIYESKSAEWVALKKKYPCCPTLYVDYTFANSGAPPFKESLNRLKNLM